MTVKGCEAGDELAQLTQDFNAWGATSQHDTLTPRLCIDVSHEFRTLATSIRGFFATLLRDEELDPAQRRTTATSSPLKRRLIRLSQPVAVSEWQPGHPGCVYDLRAGRTDPQK